MAFIEPMHRNKPNITYLLTYDQPVRHNHNEDLIIKQFQVLSTLAPLTRRLQLKHI